MSKTLPWYKRDVDAWRGGTRSMSLELRGFYSECLDGMWDRQGALPKDVAHLAILLCCNPRSIRKLLPQLIGLGKLVETTDGYMNARMEAEIEAVNSEQKPAKASTKSQPIQPELEPNSNGIHVEFEPKVPENSMFSTREKERDGEEEKEKEIIRPRARPDSNPAGARAEIYGLNGSTKEIIDGIARFLNAHAPDYETAKRVVASNVELYSPNAVRDGYAELMADMADNKVRVPSFKALIGYFKTAHQKGARQAKLANAIAPKKTLRDVLNERAAAAAAGGAVQ